jgi:microcompartment protein CcmK/EutM
MDEPGGPHVEIAQVVGNAVSSMAMPALTGFRLAVIELRDGTRELAVDTLHAGEGATVLIVRGTAARIALDRPESPVDTAIAAILDSISEPPLEKESSDGK